MNRKIMNMLDTNVNRFVVFAIIFFTFGILFTLSLRYLKYTEYIIPTISDINPVEAYQNILKNKNDIIFIDVRSEIEYAKAHATSSVNLPIHYLYDDTHGVLNGKHIPVPKNTDKTIYLTCTGGRLAGVAYSYLEHYGYRNIKRIKGGLSGWSEAGLPMITSDALGGFKSNPAPLDKPYDGK